MICAGNWKLNKNLQEAAAFVTELLKEAQTEEQINLVLLPPALVLAEVVRLTLNSKIQVGAQNCHSQLSGAFTGENSASTLKSIGAQYCLVGHSERRQIFGEDDALLAEKVSILQGQSVTPILCVGESLTERDSGKTYQVLSRQLDKALARTQEHAPLWVAYEPVWAIGTGKVASAAQVQETHLFIRNWLNQHHPNLKNSPLLYGGSVKPENASELARLANVDGFLIGGASLEVKSFLGILRSN